MTTKRLSLIFVVVVVANLNDLHAESAVRRLDQANGAMQNIPIRDQFGKLDDSGICYAITSSILIDAFRFSHGEISYSKLTSPVSLAVLAKSIKPGFPDDGLGFFSAGQLLDYVASGKIRRIGTEHSSPILRYGFIPDITKLRTDRRFAQSPFDTEQLRDIGVSFADILSEYSVHRSPVPFLLRQFYRETEANESPLEFLSKISSVIYPWRSNPLLKYSVELGQIRASDFTPQDRQSIFRETIDRELNRSGKPQPLGIEFCREVLYRPSITTVDERGDSRRCSSPHVAVVVGIRRTPNDCQVLIRDSFGDLNRDSAIKWQIDENPGQIWLGCKELFLNTWSLIWLRERK